VNDRTAGYVRTSVTLGVLALLLLLGVARGLEAVSQPFPKGEEPPICVETTLSRGDILRVGGITVNVINAGRKPGKARATLEALEKRGFGGGTVSNRPDPKVRTVEIRVAGGRTPAARLVRTYVGSSSQVKIIDDPASTAGVTVVVGDRFKKVRKGRASLRITEDATVCGPVGTG
jgi:hypothetical protein